jgi:hypothetical protein
MRNPQQILQLSRAIYLGVAGDDLLGQGSAGTRHAQHENRHTRRVSAAAQAV